MSVLAVWPMYKWCGRKLFCFMDANPRYPSSKLGDLGDLTLCSWVLLGQVPIWAFLGEVIGWGISLHSVWPWSISYPAHALVFLSAVRFSYTGCCYIWETPILSVFEDSHLGKEHVDQWGHWLAQHLEEGWLVEWGLDSTAWPWALWVSRVAQPPHPSLSSDCGEAG